MSKSLDSIKTLMSDDYDYWYAVINKRGDRITKIYDIFDNEYQANKLLSTLLYTPLKNSDIMWYKNNDEKSIDLPRRDFGLPELICIYTDKRQKVRTKIRYGQYEVIQKCEYPLFA